MPSPATHAAITPTLAPSHDTEPLPTMTEEWSSPQQPVRESPGRAAKESAPPRKKKSSRFLIVIIVLAAIALSVFAYWYYQKRVHLRKSPADVSNLAPSAEEQFIGAPSETEEQTFLVSDGSSDSSSVSPEVTQVPSEQPKKPSPQTEKVADRSAAGTLKLPSPPPKEVAQNKPDNQPRTNDAGSPLQATTTAPSLQPPAAEQKPPDTVAPAPFVAVEKEAKIIRLEPPKFSAGAYQRGVEGQVIIQVRIDAGGKPVQTVTLRSTNDLLVQPVIDAVMGSQFAPAEMSSGPVASWLTIPFKFARRD
jgi:protein TonB